ncbi:MAG: hypothetical protein V1722_04410 [Candidatus Micrarchaeota archaeon]
MKLPNFYTGNYKLLAIIPIVLFIAALGLIFFNGVPQGVDLKGGVLLSIQAQGNVDVAAVHAAVAKVATISNIRTFASPVGTGLEVELETNDKLAKIEEKIKALQAKDSLLRELEVNATVVPTEEAVTIAQRESAVSAEIISDAKVIFQELGVSYTPIEAHLTVKEAVGAYNNQQDVYRNEVINAVKGVVNVKSYSFREVGPALSKFFLDKSREVLLISFILAAIAVFVVFRSIVPSAAVIVGAVSDIVITLGAMSLFNIPMSLASIAALLMLIGFSLDTDIMLTMRVLKRKEGTPAERVFGAFKTGSLMNLTVISAYGVLALTGLYLQIPVYFELGIVAMIGGVIDFAATWGLNAVLILSYAEKKEARV